ncbi:MAG: large conductance mechanosensitive channel protein MscL [Clostridia bacterium]|nr:large conductance mechanosensitive channel protein MscL [Clostridia bacterium]
MKKFFADFKAFISKGNILDMAVGVVVGGAFSKIVSSLVADIINPLVGLATGSVQLSDMQVILQPEIIDEVTEEVTQAEIALKYGNFLQMVIDFLIIAFSIFVILRIMMNAQKKLESLKKKEVVEEAPAEPTTKVCPFCQSEIPIKAVKCPHCTSKLKD